MRCIPLACVCVCLLSSIAFAARMPSPIPKLPRQPQPPRSNILALPPQHITQATNGCLSNVKLSEIQVTVDKSPYTYFMDLSPDGCFLLFAKDVWKGEESSATFSHREFFLHHLPSGTVTKIPLSPLMTKIIDAGIEPAFDGIGVETNNECGRFSSNGKYVTCDWYLDAKSGILALPDLPPYLFKPLHMQSYVRTSYEIATQQIWDEPSGTACDTYPGSEYAVCGKFSNPHVYNGSGSPVPIASPSLGFIFEYIGIVHATVLVGKEQKSNFMYDIPSATVHVFDSDLLEVSSDNTLIRLTTVNGSKDLKTFSVERVYVDPSSPDKPLAVTNTLSDGPFTKSYILHASNGYSGTPLAPGTPVVSIEKMATKQKIPLVLAQEGDTSEAKAAHVDISADGRIIAIMQYKKPYVVRVVGNPFMSNP